MATVYISKDLIERVDSKVEKLCKHEVQETVPNWKNETSVKANELLTRASFNEYYHLFAVMPKEWMPNTERAYLSVSKVIDENGNERTASVVFENQNNVYLRPSSERYGSSTIHVSLDWLQNNSHLAGAYEAIDLVEKSFAITDIKTKWAHTKKQVIDYLKKCKSLNEAIKLWPHVAFYIDDSDMARFNKKVERKAREDVLEGVDTDELTAQAIAAKLSGAFDL
jgi:hypothetical protein